MFSEPPLTETIAARGGRLLKRSVPRAVPPPEFTRAEGDAEEGHP
jgi:hypothetical protein